MLFFFRISVLTLIAVVPHDPYLMLIFLPLTTPGAAPLPVGIMSASSNPVVDPGPIAENNNELYRADTVTDQGMEVNMEEVSVDDDHTSVMML